MARLICLANSDRDRDRCIAGIDIETGRWVRPVPHDGSAIPKRRTYVHGSPLSLLDVVEIDLTDENPGTRFQRENRVIQSWRWRIVGRRPVSDVLRYCDFATPILHNAKASVCPTELEVLPPLKWKSLQLVRAHDVKFKRSYRHCRARFRDRAGGGPYDLAVTDPEMNRNLPDEGITISDCLLTVSLGEPWRHSGSSNEAMCYKLVAAVIEL